MEIIEQFRSKERRLVLIQVLLKYNCYAKYCAYFLPAFLEGCKILKYTITQFLPSQSREVSVKEDKRSSFQTTMCTQKHSPFYREMMKLL